MLGKRIKHNKKFDNKKIKFPLRESERSDIILMVPFYFLNVS